MSFKDKLAEYMQQIFLRLEVPRGATPEEMIRAVLEYYKADRVRYIELYDPQMPRHMHLSGDGGVFGKSIPVAQRSVTTAIRRRRCDLVATKIYTLELLVINDTVFFIENDYTVELTPKRKLMRSATYRVYTQIDPKDISPDYKIKWPCEIRPAATQSECLMYDALVNFFSKFGPYCSPDIVYHKTECAIETVPYLPTVKTPIAGTIKTGKLLEVAIATGMRSKPTIDCSHSYYDCVKVLIAEDEFQFILQTDHIYQFFRRVPIDEDIADGFICETTEEKQEREYWYADLDALDYESLIPSYY